MICLIRRGQARGAAAGSSTQGPQVTTSAASLDSTGALDSEGFLGIDKGLLLRAPFRSSSRGEPGMVFFALPGVHFLTCGAAGGFSEGVKSEGWICGVLVLHSTSSFSLTAERNNKEKDIKHQKNIEISGIHNEALTLSKRTQKC